MSTKNKEIKEIIDIDLDTGTNLVTENYQLEILGLKDLIDLRKFSRSFLKVDKLLKSIFTGKEDKIDKKSAFNKEFGVAQNEVLEGSKLAEILGIEYGGILNNNNQKIAGKGYYDTANKKIYKCTANTSINYADSAYFEEISNNDLLGKFKNLNKINEYFFLGEYLIQEGLTLGSVLNIALSDSILNYKFYAIAVTDGMDTVTSDFIFNSVELRGIRHRFLSDSMGDILMTSNKYYDFDSAYFNTRTNFTFTVFRIGNPDFSIDNNNKVRIFGVGKIQ